MNDNNSNLISDKSLKSVEKIFKKNKINIHKHINWQENLYHFYSEYIQPNLFPLIIFILIALFLSIRYILKKEKETYNIIRKLKQKEHSQHPSYQQHIDPFADTTKPYVDSEIENYSNDLHFDDENNDSQLNNNNNYDNDDVDISMIQDHYDRLKQTGELNDVMIDEYKKKDISKLEFNEIARLLTGNY